MRSQTRPRPRQRTLRGVADDLEVPLHEVTFCAVDVETTSGSARTGEIIEIGAVKARGGEILGTFETFVQPSSEVPVEIQLLTGITPRMLEGALPLPAVLPSFIGFSAGAVFVAHNASFDRSFIDAACRRLDYETSQAPVVDTVRLARRLLRGEVRSCGLATLAAHFRVDTAPCHRAFPDAAACLEVLWALLERASAYGVTTLADLLEIQSVRSDPNFEKVKLARELPASRGVYLFENARREVIYVGKASNLRARVRSYFTSDERKRMSDLRAEVADVRVIGCATDLEAAALEARLIERYTPRYNRVGVRRRSPVYLRLTDEPHPRFAVARRIRGGRPGDRYIGPFASTARARAVAATLSGLFGLRTCTLRLSASPEGQEPCALYQLGSCHGPCTGRPQDTAHHSAAAAGLREDVDRGGLREGRRRLELKLAGLAAERRFEEAAGHRDAFADAVRALARAQRLRSVARAGRVEVELPEGRVVLEAGRLAGSGSAPPGDLGSALDLEGLGERSAVAACLERSEDIRLVSSEHPLHHPWPRAELLERLELQE